MSVFKNSISVLEIAVRIEKEVIKFYTSLAEMTTQDAVIDVLLRLIDDEERHLKTFKNILEKNATYKPMDDYPGEYGKFLNETAALSIRAFQTVPRLSNFLESINYAIQTEMQAIVFYTEILKDENLPDIELIEKIIQEEKSHLIQLSNLKSQYGEQ